MCSHGTQREHTASACTLSARVCVKVCKVGVLAVHVHAVSAHSWCKQPACTCTLVCEWRCKAGVLTVHARGEHTASVRTLDARVRVQRCEVGMPAVHTISAHSWCKQPACVCTLGAGVRVEVCKGRVLAVHTRGASSQHACARRAHHHHHRVCAMCVHTGCAQPIREHAAGARSGCVCRGGGVHTQGVCAGSTCTHGGGAHVCALRGTHVCTPCTRACTWWGCMGLRHRVGAPRGAGGAPPDRAVPPPRSSCCPSRGRWRWRGS